MMVDMLRFRTFQPPTPHSSFRLLFACLGVFICLFTLLFSSTAGERSHEPWQWPTGSPRPVLVNFDPPDQPWLPGNRGVVLDVQVGEVIVAPAPGRVTLARRIVDREVVVVSHDERRSTFEPVTALVPEGSFVTTGQPIGVVSSGPNGPLHWGVKVGKSTYLHPLRQLLGPIILKPWDEPDDR